MIKPSNMYALAVDREVVAKGSRKAMEKLRKHRGGIVWNSPSSRIGDTMPKAANQQLNSEV